MNDKPAPAFPWPVYWLLLAALLLFTLAPVITVFTSIGIAEAAGCVLNEAGANPCPVMGLELGDTLAFMFVFGWFALITLPLGGGALIVWLVMLIIHRLAWGRMQKSETP